MANPKRENGFTAFINELMDIAAVRLFPSEYVVWSIVVRMTEGFGRESVEISRARLAARCAMSERQVARLLAALVAYGVLYIRHNGPKPMTITLENDYDTWRTSRGVPATEQQDQNDVTDTAQQDQNDVTYMSHQGPKCCDVHVTSRASYQLEERNKNKRYPQPSLEAMEIAQKYHARIRTILPSLARSIGSQADEKGAVALDALVRIDGHDWELIKSVLRWALTDAFWARNLRSLASARTRGKNGSTKFENCLSQYEMTRETVRAHGAPAVQTVTHTLTEDELSARRAANELWSE